MLSTGTVTGTVKHNTPPIFIDSFGQKKYTVDKNL